jgi:hypothetical protein
MLKVAIMMKQNCYVHWISWCYTSNCSLSLTRFRVKDLSSYWHTHTHTHAYIYKGITNSLTSYLTSVMVAKSERTTFDAVQGFLFVNATITNLFVLQLRRSSCLLLRQMQFLFLVNVDRDFLSVSDQLVYNKVMAYSCLIISNCNWTGNYE